MPETPNNPESKGGQGEPAPNVLTDPHRTRGDLAMVETAIRRRWPIPEATRKKLIDRIDGVLGDNDPDKAMAAGRVLVSMEGQNQADEHLDDKNKRLDSGKETERIGGTIKVIEGVNPELL